MFLNTYSEVLIGLLQFTFHFLEVDVCFLYTTQDCEFGV